MTQSGSQTETNKAIVQRYFEELLNRGNFAVAADFISTDYVNRGEPPRGGAAGYAQRVGLMRTAFPDLHITFDDIIAEGELVAYHTTWSGTHLGEFRGIPPTGKRITWTVTAFRRVVDGKVVEGWGTYDWLSVLEQMGRYQRPW
jgi:steroid delta-isomerase-like uncharacterized protein